MKKILIIQTAFIGDVILSTSLIEKLHIFYPDASLDFLLRKDNENILHKHPYINEVLIWEKKRKKLINLWFLLLKIRGKKYDVVINIQRFASTGFLTAFSGAKEKIGFKKNPFSNLFSKRISHSLNQRANYFHEIERNHKLIEALTDNVVSKPRLYPGNSDILAVNPFITPPYICISPASVWFTKQFPKKKWIDFLENIDFKLTVYILGSQDDISISEQIKSACHNYHISITNLCGKLSLLQSAFLMQGAQMNYVNDSAPLHLCSAMNAPVTAIFCATVPSFGFGPLSDITHIVENTDTLKCRPCNNHGKMSCPEKHFDCAYNIDINILINILRKSFNNH